MVTHELEIASHASRVIVMRDGNIISDQKQGNNQNSLREQQSTAVVAEVLQSSRKR